ncbi:MAG: helix-turn-helix transcriptional regulator [Pseudomonadota bacterium]
MTTYMVLGIPPDLRKLAKGYRDPAIMDLNDHPADHASAPIVGDAWNAVGPQYISTHSHVRGQIIYTAEGCVTVEVTEGLFVVPAHRALWVPPAVTHSAHYPDKVAFRGIYVSPDLCSDLPLATSFLQVDALSRELIEAAAHRPWDYAEDSPDSRLMNVLLDQIRILADAPLALPDARDERLRRVTAELRGAPNDNRTLADWASLGGMSERNFTRRFREETGMSFSAWRQQLLVLKAVEKLAIGEAVTRVAIDLGFASPSSFAAMFKRETGFAPSAYFTSPRDDVVDDPTGSRITNR